MYRDAHPDDKQEPYPFTYYCWCLHHQLLDICMYVIVLDNEFFIDRHKGLMIIYSIIKYQ